MNLRTFLVIAAGAAMVALATGCNREQPASEAPPAESASPSTPDQGATPVTAGEVCDTVITQTAKPSQAQPTPARRALPRLVDLGRGTCIPCKKMAPILSELTEEYRGRAVVEVIDLRDKPQAAQEYGIKLIPTQVFYDAKGKEVWRHEGFLPKDQIVAKFEELGVKPN